MTTFDDLFAVDDRSDTVLVLPAAPRTDERQLFGGILLAQAVAAATPEGSHCHSLHGLFLDGGWMDEPFNVEIETLRQGRSFTMRRVEIRQRGRLLFTGFTGHHGGDAGPARQIAMPAVPSPETLADQRAARLDGAAETPRRLMRYLAEDLLDIRAVDLPADEGERRRALWFRPRIDIRGGPAIHQSALAFASDVGLLHVGLQKGVSLVGQIQSTSLDHALWFHRPATLDDWMLQLQSSPILCDGRGFSRSSLFTRCGQLVATSSQEFLARDRTSPKLKD